MKLYKNDKSDDLSGMTSMLLIVFADQNTRSREVAVGLLQLPEDASIVCYGQETRRR